MRVEEHRCLFSTWRYKHKHYEQRLVTKIIRQKFMGKRQCSEQTRHGRTVNTSGNSYKQYDTWPNSVIVRYGFLTNV